MPVVEELNRLRKRLLDLSPRNRLLSYRHTTKSSLRVIDETVDFVVDKLLEKDKELIFAALPVLKPADLEKYWLSKGVLLELDKKEYKVPDEKDWAVYKKINPSYELLGREGSILASYRDNYLQTLHYSEDLEAILRKISTSANTAIQETGTNILYLACGFLEWKEDENSDLIRHAPLLLIPVVLTKGDLDKDVRAFHYKVSYSGEDLLKNISLDFKMREDFGFSIPDLPENLAPEIYFREVEAVLSRHKPTWKVRRNITLGLFNFGKLLMYLDLDPEKWPKSNNIADHELVNRLFAGEVAGQAVSAEPYEDDINIDEREREERLTYLVCDADSSQNSCIIDAIDGKNLVIAGPPGTGKSQTITNIISAALFKKKTVLFVSEKMAALEVVRGRMDKLGLGDFCLELHSHKTQKSKLVQDLKQRLGLLRLRFDGSRFSEKVNSMFASRDALSEYAASVNKQYGESGLTVREVLGRFSKYKDNVKKQSPEGMLKDLEGMDCGHLPIKIKYLDKLKGQLAAYRTNYQKIFSRGASKLKHDWDLISRLPSISDGVDAEIFFDETPTKQQIVKELSKVKEGLGRVQTVIGEIQSKVPCLKIATSQDIAVLLASYDAVTKHQVEYSWDIIYNLSNNPHDYVSEYAQRLSDFKKSAAEVGQYLKTTQKFFENNLIEVKLVDDLRELLCVVVSKIPDGVKVNQLLDLEDGLKTIADKKLILESLDGIIQNYFSSWGLKDISMSEAINVVFGIFTALANLPLSGATGVKSMYGSAERKHIISYYQASHKKLLAVKTDLDKVFDFQQIDAGLDLHGILIVLKSARWWSCLKPAHREAIRKYKRIFKSGVNRNAKYWVSDLQALIDFREKQKSLSDDEDLKKCFGVLFKDVDSSLSEILEVDQWIDRVEQSFYPLCRDRKKYIDLIFNLNTNEMIALNKLATGDFHRRLSDFKDFVFRLRAAEFFTEDAFVYKFIGENKLDLSMLFSAIRSYLSEQFFHIDLKRLIKILSLHKELLVDFSEVKAKKLYGISVGHISDIDETIRALDSNKEFAMLLRDKFGTAEIFNHIESLSKIDPLKSFLELISRVEPVHEDYIRSLNEIRAYRLDEKFIRGEFHVFASKIDSAINSGANCEDWFEYLEAKRELSELGFGKIVFICEEKPEHEALIEDIIFYKIFFTAAQDILRSEPIIKDMADGRIDSIRQKFSDLDNEIMRLNAQKVIAELQAVNPPNGSAGPRVKDKTEMSLIRHQIELTRRHVPIRALISRASKALQTIKPCFMMSPMSLAQYLPPGQINFDLVIMDEASQIRPEEALSAIARGSQVVIVGDTCQLPPTSFFNRVADGGPDDGLTGLEDAESILEIASSSFHRDRRMLRWHYRSKHESLISFSNKFFYDNKLVLFPSPNIKSDNSGIIFNYVKGTYKESINVQEAKEIVLAVKRNILENPSQSVGLVAMNVQQQEILEIELENLLKEDGEFESVFSRHQKKIDESLFIKNLESVQGDERDAIFVSMTYGPDEAGNVMQRFGPVNAENGWRRLNVLFTRARQKVCLFSSMKNGDVLVDHNSSRGVRALKNYLQFAESGVLPVEPSTAVNPENPDAPEVNFFEKDVMNEIKNMGYACDSQIGVSEYFIDIGVRDPNNPNKYMVGIECDGATYHSAKSARDRDRLRQKILIGLGWKIYRIWSTDWFKNRGQQLIKLRAALKDFSIS